MKLVIRTPILLICILTLSLGSCTKVKTKDDQKSDENSIDNDRGDTSVPTTDVTDSGKRQDSSVTMNIEEAR